MSLQPVSSENDPRTHIPQVWGSLIPKRLANFTGRAELLDELHAKINQNVTAVLPHAVQGQGGVGKTMLAVEFAHRFRDEYDLVWWIPSDRPALLQSALAHLAPYLGLASFSVTGVDDASNAVLDSLRRGDPYRRWLLIFDNADQPEDLIDLLPQGTGHVLITSRNPRWEGAVNTLSVEVFRRVESVEFLLKRTKGKISRKNADRIAEALGDLPLALEQAGALIFETGMSVEEYLQLLADNTKEVLGQGTPSGYPASMSGAWATSVAFVRGRLPEAITVLQYCAFFSPEPIPRRVFTGTQVGLVPALDGLVGRPLELNKVIYELARYALLKVDAQNNTVQVHRLVQALVRDSLTAEDRTRHQHEANLLLTTALPQDPDVTARENWRRYAELVSHVNRQETMEADDPALRSLALNMARYLYLSGQLAVARPYVDDLVHLWQAAAAPPELDILLARRLQGLILRMQGEHVAAQRMNQEILAGLRSIEGEAAKEAVLLQLNSIGADLRASGDFHEAVAHDAESVRQHEETLGVDDANTLRALHNYALDLGLVSRYRDARDAHEEAQRRQSLSQSPVGAPTLVGFTSGLSRTIRLLGDFRNACDFGEDAVALGKRELGPEHPATLRATVELSIALRRAAEYDDSLERAETAHLRLLGLSGPRNPTTMAAAMALANILRTVGRNAESMELTREYSEHYAGVFGREHPFYFGCLSNLAVGTRLAGDPQEARRVNERALAGLESKLTRDHDYALVVAANLATDLAVLGEVDAAVRLGRGTLRRVRTLLGPEHPTALACAANLAADLGPAGEAEEGDRLYRETMAAYDRTVRLDHPDALVAADRRHQDLDFDPPPI